MLLLLAGDAAHARNWQAAYNIASQVDDALPAGSAGRRPADRHPRQLHQPRLARREHRPPADSPARQRARHVRPLRARRPLAPGADQRRLLGRPRRARRGAFPDGDRLFPARRRLPRSVLRPARARAARPRGAGAARGASAIYDDVGSSGRRSTAGGSFRRFARCNSSGRRPRRRCSSRRSRNRSIPMSTGTWRWSWPSRSAGRTCPCGSPGWRA